MQNIEDTTLTMLKTKNLKDYINYLSDWSHLTASNDFISGLTAVHVWGTLGLHDIRQRYRRSILGPLWFTISTLVYVGAMGVIYSTILDQKIEDYNAYLGIGMITWQLISAVMLEGCNSFISAAGLIKQMKMPLTVHVCRLVWRNFIIFFHNLPIFVLLIALQGHKPGAKIFLVVPAMGILFLIGVALSVILGILCARYRDVSPIMSNIVQVAFFITPIMFEPKLLKGYMWLAEFNPFYHLIEIIRGPIIGHDIHWTSWISSIILMFLTLYASFIFLKKYRDRVAYWL